MRMRTSERRICCGVKPLRPVSAFFNPRARSQRTCSIMSFWSSRKSEMACKQRLKTQALTHQFPLGKTDVSLHRSRHRSALIGLLRFGALSLERFDISRCRLVQQILQRAPVVQPALHLRNELLRNIDRNATPFRAIVKHIALMLFARQTSRAVRANAPAAPQAQRAEKRRPQNRSFTLKPAHDIRRRFRINVPHVRYVSTDTRTFQENASGKNAKSRPF